MKPWLWLLGLMLASQSIWAKPYAANIKNVRIEHNKTDYNLSADLDFNLSPVAKDALQKGVLLSWDVRIKVQQIGLLWDSTIASQTLNYQIQYHALMNLYSVKKLHIDSTEMFSSLTAAMSSMAKIRLLPVIKKQQLDAAGDYQLAMKVFFRREALPTPVRPFSYFDPQWALSSEWTLWPIER